MTIAEIGPIIAIGGTMTKIIGEGRATIARAMMRTHYMTLSKVRNKLYTREVSMTLQNLNFSTIGLRVC